MISTLQNSLLELYIHSGQYKKAVDIYKDYISASQAATQQMQEDMQASRHRESFLYKAIIAVLSLAVATLAFYTVKIIKK